MKFMEEIYMNRHIEALWEAISEQVAVIKELQYEIQELREQLAHLRS